MKKTTNTKNNPQIDWLFGRNPNAILDQEKQGQEELVASQQLPKICNYPRGVNAAEQYTKMGIKVFTTSKGDDLFLGVKLPIGWKKEFTDHSMWNNLIDANGYVRATFFYKAAFYDRDAFINFKKRYSHKEDVDNNRDCIHIVVDSATNKVLFSTEKLYWSERSDKEQYRYKDELYEQQCKDFLDTNYPEHEDINAYWD